MSVDQGIYDFLRLFSGIPEGEWFHLEGQIKRQNDEITLENIKVVRQNPSNSYINYITAATDQPANEQPTQWA